MIRAKFICIYIAIFD